MTTKFNEWSLQWLHSMRGTVKDNTYYSSYKIPVERHLNPVFQDTPLSKISSIDIQNYFAERYDIFSLETLKKDKHCLKRIFTSAQCNGLCNINPVLDIKLKHNNSLNEMEIYTPKEVELIYAYAEYHRYGDEIYTMLETGMRRGELLALKWDDIDFARKTISIKRAVSDCIDSESGKYKRIIDIPKNEYSIRTMPISSSLCNVLLRRKAMGHCEFVFPNQYGNVCSPRNWSRRHYDVFMRDMQNFYKQQDIYINTYSPHALRHTRASIWVNNGLNLYAISKILGHSDLQMLRKRYAHSNVDEIRRLMNII